MSEPEVEREVLAELPVVLGLPTLEQLRIYVAIPASVLSDENLERIYAAELDVQIHRCRTPEDVALWPSPLAQAAIRRVQREIAAKGLALGFVDGGGDYGPARIPQYDAMIENLERAYKVVVFG